MRQSRRAGNRSRLTVGAIVGVIVACGTALVLVLGTGEPGRSPASVSAPALPPDEVAGHEPAAPASQVSQQTQTRAVPVNDLAGALCGARVLPSQHRGMAFAHSTREGGYGSPLSAESLAELADIGVDWITITPFGWQRAVDDPEITLRTDRGESDERLTAVTAQARELGIRVMMKPHLWLRGGGWRGDIGFESEADWQQWFRSYTDYIVHYARLSERLGIDMFVVGVELASSSASRPDDWRRVIAAVRAVYSGPLVYAANWDEVDDVQFWDALDYVGVQMFAPLSVTLEPAREELLAAADLYLRRFQAISLRTDRPLLLTEVGFKAVVGTTLRPWDWPDRGDRRAATEADQTAQAEAYCAIIGTFGQADFVAGMYWWKWFSNVDTGSEGPTGFSPRGKLAEQVLRWAFRGTGDSATEPPDQRLRAPAWGREIAD